ncbi:hypothetical protein DQ04_00861140 [Trypanosoma grayi]|uniref:hypothetical protein n=1 Tax=Trypanosoma grayi TaxID=71804 RepID=UPI0004F4052B|nr:hypothetical protein DQ04_00861140 [Trypanosoma grayi]KEG13672.1 hypothetical protein DQ04_00861140 [Trypanosoma grayi]
MVFGALILRLYIQAERARIEGVLFDQLGSCSILYFNCTSPTVTLFASGVVRTVKVWDNVASTYFCSIPSSSYVPCWWSETPRLSAFVRFGPVPVEMELLLPFSVTLICVGVAVAVVGFLVLLHHKASGDSGWLLWWVGRDDQNRQDRGGDTEGVQLNSGVLVVENHLLHEADPISDPVWMNKAVIHTPFAERRLAILARFFERRREKMGVHLQLSEPYSTTSAPPSEAEFDDDDLPVDECYVCLSHLRRRLIWWPCGHWLCASCLRKVLRGTRSPGDASCPNCRGIFSHEQLLVLHLQSRKVPQGVVTDSGAGPNDAAGSVSGELATSVVQPDLVR